MEAPASSGAMPTSSRKPTGRAGGSGPAKPGVTSSLELKTPQAWSDRRRAGSGNDPAAEARREPAGIPAAAAAAHVAGAAGGRRSIGVTSKGATKQQRPHSEWKFALVLGHKDDGEGCCSGRRVAGAGESLADVLREIDPTSALHEEGEGGGNFEGFVLETCGKLTDAGFQIGIVERTAQTKDRVILLLRMGEERLRSEYRRLQVERWHQTGAGVVFRELAEEEEQGGAIRRSSSHRHQAAGGAHHAGARIAEDINPTEADRVQVFAEQLSHHVGLGNLDHLHDRYGPAEDKPDERVLAVFPVKDKQWESQFMKQWAKEGGVVRSCTRIREEFRDAGLELAAETQGALKRGGSIGRGLVSEVTDLGQGVADAGMKHTLRFGENLTKVKAVAHTTMMEVAMVNSARKPPAALTLEGTDTATGALAGATSEEQRTWLQRQGSGGSGGGSRGSRSSAMLVGGARAVASAVSVEGVTKLTEKGYDAGRQLTTAGYDAGRQLTTGVARASIGVTKGVAAVGVGVGVSGVKTGVRLAETGVQSGVVVVKGLAGVVWGAKLFVHKVAIAFWTRDDIFIDELRENYGERVGIYFAFLNNYSNSLMPLAIVLLLFFIIGNQISWLVYLRGIGLMGMLTASCWGPLVIIAWRRRSNGLLFHWGMMDTQELPQQSAFCDHSTYDPEKKGLIHARQEGWSWRKLGLFSGLVVLVIVLIILLFGANFVLITLETQLMWAPVCGTYMDQVIQDSNDGWLPCMKTTSLDPWGGDRGLLFLLLGILTGLLIDVVYVELFNLLADTFVKALHIRSQQDYEDRLVHIMFPFHWGGFMFYFLLLAAFVPFGGPITAFVESATNIVSLEVDTTSGGHGQSSQPADGNTTALSANGTSAYLAPGDRLAKEDYWNFWTYEKRFMLQMDTAMVGPLVVAVWLEFALGQALPWVQYVRTRYLVRRRGGGRLRCGAMLLTRLTCCCGGDPSPVLVDVIADAADKRMMSGNTQPGSYSGLVQRVAQQLSIDVELVGGRWHPEVVDETVFEREAAAVSETDDTAVDAQAANALLLESQLPLLELHVEYMQIAQQFAYVTVFTVFWALAPMMNLTRCALEAQADAFKMFQYYRRPIPSKPPTPATIGGWEKALEIQVYLACVLTSAFFVFCSGELEAWSEVWVDTPLPTDTELREGSWEGCVPIAQTYTHHWKYGPASGCGAVTDEPWDEKDEVETFKSVMAPNLDCWNEQKINNTLQICEQPPTAGRAGEMSWDQLAKRVMVFLLLNHVQFFVVWLCYRSWSQYPADLKDKINGHLRDQKKLMAKVLFNEEPRAVREWQKVRGAVRALQMSKLRQRKVPAKVVEAAQAAGDAPPQEAMRVAAAGTTTTVSRGFTKVKRGKIAPLGGDVGSPVSSRGQPLPPLSPPGRPQP